MRLFQQISSFTRKPAFRSAGIYTFSNFSVKGIAFLLLFVYSNPKYLSVEENGLLSLMSSAVFMFMPFLALGIVQSTTVDFFKLPKEEFKDFFTTSFVLPFITMIVGMGLMAIFSENLQQVYHFPPVFAFIIPLLAFLGFVNEQYVSLIRNNDEPYTYFKASMLRMVIEISLSVTLVIAFAWRWYGRVTGILVANTILFVVAYIYFRRKGYLFGAVKKKYLKSELLYALPIIIMQCSTFCLASSDKFFLSYFSTNNVVGVYSYACVFAAVVTIACSSLISYVMPRIYAALAAPAIDYKQIKKYFTFYVAGCFTVLIAIVACTPVMYKFFINDAYHSGLKYMYIIAIGYFLWSVINFFYAFLLYNKQKKKILVLSLISIAINLTSNYFLISKWDAMGAAVSVCISYFLMLVTTLIISYKNVRLLFAAK